MRWRNMQIQNRVTHRILSITRVSCRIAIVFRRGDVIAATVFDINSPLIKLFEINYSVLVKWF